MATLTDRKGLLKSFNEQTALSKTLTDNSQDGATFGDSRYTFGSQEISFGGIIVLVTGIILSITKTFSQTSGTSVNLTDKQSV